ncbi:MAG: PH domain-containing protein [Parvularculaceae bacterium]
MTYVSKSLGADETLLREAGIAWPFHAKAWLALLLLGVFVIGVVIFVSVQVWIATTEFALTDRRVILKRGWLRRRTEELSLTSVEEVSIEQGFFGRLFNFGRLVIAGSGRGEVKSPPISDPIGFRSEMSDARAAFLKAAA